MSFFLPRRWAPWLLFLPLFSQAQVSEGNYLQISLVSQHFDCSSGQASVVFHISNLNQFGYTGGYRTIYSIDLGASSITNRTLPSGDGDVSFTGSYHPGDEVVCSAWGYNNNDAPEEDYRLVLSGGAIPSIPVINSSSAMPLCDGASVTLSASGDPGSTFTWSNGSTAGSINVSDAGSYTVHAVGACGISAESSPFTVTVATTPSAPVIGSSNGSLLCNGISSTISSTSSGGTIHWSNGATGTSITTSLPGSYYASETNGCGTSGNSNVVTISVATTPPAPSVSSSNGTSLCNGASTTLSAAPAAGGSINWNTGAAGNAITVSSPGSYYAVESNSCGTSGQSNVVSITAGSAPSAPSITSSNGTLLCNGASTVLSASGAGTITWNTGEVNGSIAINGAGSYYAVASNGCGTSGQSNTLTIATGVTPGAPTVTSSAGSLLCNGAATQLSTSPFYGGSIFWSTGASGNTFSVSSAGSYYAYETNGCGSGTNSNVVSIATAAKPAAPSVSPSADQPLCNGASVTLSASGSDVLWSNGATGNSIIVSSAGAYYAIDRNACGNSPASHTVNVTTVVCPVPVPGGSFLVCPGSLKTLDAGEGYDSYEWSNGAATRTVSVGPGTYTVTVSKSGCYASSAAVTVGYYAVSTPAISASGATTFCAGGSVDLFSREGTAYSWNTGEVSASIHVTESGAYYVTVTDANGCAATSAAVSVSVNPLPTATVSGGGTVCQNGSSKAVTFTATGGEAPYTFSYTINGGTVQRVTTSSGNSVSIDVPSSSPGSFTYSLVAVQESSSTACTNTASGSATVTVTAVPTASISGDATICKNSSPASVSFTGNGGSGPYTFTYTVNGGVNQVVSTSSGNSVSVAVPTTSAGTFVYALVSVQESGSCMASASGQATITIHASPSATISGSATVCQGAASPVVNFEGSGGTAPYTFRYRVNGGTEQTITTVSGSSVTLSVPTDTPGDFTYELLGVQENSGTSCSGPASGSVTVSVHGLPTATISGNTAVCRNSAAPAVVFTGSGGTAPYTFSYRVNSGSLQTISTTTGNSIAVSVPTVSDGSFAYTLEIVQEASGTACATTVTGDATVVVNPLPTATMVGSARVCQNSSSPELRFTGTGGTAPYTFTCRINGGAEQTIVSSGNTAVLSAPTQIEGVFTYSLLRVQESSSTSCSNAATGDATIVVEAQPVKAVITAANTHLCNGDTGVIRILNYAPGTTYYWYKDGGLLRSSTEDTLKVHEGGSYTVLPVSAEGCAAAAVSEAITITTGSVTTPIITGSLKVCPEGKTLLTATTAVESSYERWRWSSPPGAEALSEDSSFFAGAGQYRLWVSAQGCADSVSVAVTADDTGFPAGRLTITPASIAYGGQSTLTAEVSGAAKYRWVVSDGQAFETGGNRIEHRFYQSGDSIPVSLWATSERNCTSLFTSFVKVGPMTRDTLPDNSFTGTVRDWNVFPIPFSDRIQVTAVLKRAETVLLDLFTAEGRWVRSWQYRGQKGENLFVVEGLQNLLSGAFYFITGFYNGEKHAENLFKQ